MAALTPLLEGLLSRVSTADGLAERRRPVPYEGEVPVETEPGSESRRWGPDLGETLLRRRSTLRYGDEPVPVDMILPLLRSVLERDRMDWGLNETGGVLEAFVFALRDEEPRTGVYRVNAQGSWRLGGLEEIGPLENLGVQREFATAAGIVALYADLDRADTWAGAHGYRICAVRAAMATYDFHLRCQGKGLVGTLFGGFIPSSVRHLVHGDGVTRQPLLAATYARPPASGDGRG